MTQPRKVRWVLAHEPIELFLRAARVFAEEVNAKAPGQLELEVMTLSEFSKKYNNGEQVNKHDLVSLLDQNKIEMSQTYTITLGRIDKDFQALDLPFLFTDHDHASRVFEGPIGKKLLDGLTEKVGVKGLAFTYSGGFRIIPGNETVSRIEDLRGIKVRTSHSPVAIDTFKAVGAEVVPMELEELTDKLGDAEVDIGESTYPRVYALGQNKVSKVVNHTEHSLFLTSILVSEDFWNTLTPELQAIVSKAAVNAARHERDLSIEDVRITRERCMADGIEVVDLSKEEQDKFREATKEVYIKYENYFSPGLVDAIRKQ
jgi:TRAP-type C4-dicarboxylate transport system substrate-binding protein